MNTACQRYFCKLYNVFFNDSFKGNLLKVLKHLKEMFVERLFDCLILFNLKAVFQNNESIFFDWQRIEMNILCKEKQHTKNEKKMFISL